MTDTSEHDDRYYYESQPIFHIGGEHSTVNIFLGSGHQAEVGVAPAPTPSHTPTSISNARPDTFPLNVLGLNVPNNTTTIPPSFNQPQRHEQRSDSRETRSANQPQEPLQNLLNSTLNSLPVQFLSPGVRGAIEQILNNHGQTAVNVPAAQSTHHNEPSRTPSQSTSTVNDTRNPRRGHVQESSPETERNISVSFVMHPQTSNGRSNMNSLIQTLLGQSSSNRGLDLEQLNEHTEVEVVSNQNEEPDRCAVCHDPILEGQIVRRVRRCNHRFHSQCLDRWLEANHTCPLCMQTIVPSTEDTTEDMTDEALNHDEEREPLIDPSDRELAEDGGQDADGSNNTAEASVEPSATQRTPPPTLPITVRSIRRVYNTNTGEITTEQHATAPQNESDIAQQHTTDRILEATLAEFAFDDEEGVFRI